MLKVTITVHADAEDMLSAAEAAWVLVNRTLDGRVQDNVIFTNPIVESVE